MIERPYRRLRCETGTLPGRNRDARLGLDLGELAFDAFGYVSGGKHHFEFAPKALRICLRDFHLKKTLPLRVYLKTIPLTHSRSTNMAIASSPWPTSHADAAAHRSRFMVRAEGDRTPTIFTTGT